MPCPGMGQQRGIRRHSKPVRSVNSIGRADADAGQVLEFGNDLGPLARPERRQGCCGFVPGHPAIHRCHEPPCPVGPLRKQSLADPPQASCGASPKAKIAPFSGSVGGTLAFRVSIAN